MAENAAVNRNGISLRIGVSAADEILHAWFIRDVLPLEAVLMQFLRNNWRNASEVEDLCQDVYTRAYEAAAVHEVPERTKPFVFAIARNLLIDRMRHAQIVPIEAISDLEELDTAADEPAPDRSAIAKDELHKLNQALENLPPRCREVVILKRLEDLTRKQIAERLGISEYTVAEYLARGMWLLTDALYRAPSGRQR
ncbi:MAG TPA: RNA polymerase sigma factor [Rhizomicrobium sp.]|jgi:RNA polymerase sigma factor (sigma-70 family)|nr:RNA polymerase sigma factor [Rhizomicrobium sp.]